MINRKKNIDKTPTKQGADVVISEPDKIGVSTRYDFEATNLTAYGGLLPVAAMLEQLGFQQLVEETLTLKRIRGPCQCTNSCWRWFWRRRWDSHGDTTCGL